MGDLGSELKSALGRVQASWDDARAEVGAREFVRRRRRREVVRALGGSAALVLLVAAGGIALWRTRAQPRPTMCFVVNSPETSKSQ